MKDSPPPWESEKQTRVSYWINTEGRGEVLKWPFWQTIASPLLLLQGQKEGTGAGTGIRWFFWYFYFHRAFSWHTSCSPCLYGTAVIATSVSAGLCCHLCYSGVYGCTEIGAWNEKVVYEGGWIQDFLSAFTPIFVSLFHKKELSWLFRT